MNEQRVQQKMSLKIAMIDPSLFTWAYDSTLSEALIGNGHTLSLYTKHLSNKEQGKGISYVREVFYPGFQNRVLRYLPQAIVLSLKGISHIFSMVALAAKLRRDRPDVIHFQWAPLPAADRFLMGLFRRIAPVVLTVHDSSPFNNNPSSRLQSIGSIEVLKHFDGLIVHTDKALAALQRKGIKSSTLTRISHGVLGAAIRVKPMTQRSADAPVTLLLFGYLKHYKGADILIEALAKMPARSLAKVRLHVVGKPLMDTTSLIARAKELGLADKITWDLRFVGDDEIENIFSESDITVMPYREIDASGVLMVALAIGRPIVASRIGIFAELLEEGKHGFLVTPEDPSALSDALTRLVDGPLLRQAMGAEVSALGTTVPSWKEIAFSTEHLYRQLMAAWSERR
jgi:glycosyltransferase involved in cell wall biosynthesis